MKNLKKVLAMVLAFACTFTMFAGAKVFEDVPAGSDYSEAITMLSDLGIIQGKDDGKYHPEDTITRAEACAMIARMMTGDPNVSQYVGAQNFTDVAKGSWKDSAIGYCYINNIVIGVGNNKFEPDRAITDAEFITMVVRAMGYETPDMAQGYPYTYMSNAQAIGLLDGVNMVANTDALRGEDAQVIYNALFADYARGAKLVNTTHGTSVETYPTLAESVWGLERAAVGTWDKDDKDDETAELTNCKAHTWVVVGADKKEEGHILAYPIDDDTTDLYDSDEKNAFRLYSFEYSGDVESIKGYQVELWGQGSHGEPTWENGDKKFVYSDNWEIKAIKTVKGQSEYDYNASMADSKSDNGTIELDDVSLDLESVADNAANITNDATYSDLTTYLSKDEYNGVKTTSDKKVEEALNVRDGAQYKLMDWDSDGDVDWVVVDEANYYKVESVNSKRLTLSAMKAGEDEEKSTKSETITWKLDDLNDENDYKIKVEGADDLEEGDIIEVTYSNGYDKGEKSEVVTATVSVVDAEAHELDKVSTKDHLVLTFNGETMEIAQAADRGDVIVPNNPSTYEGFDEEELGTSFSIWTDRNGFIIYSDYETETSNYMMVLDTDDGDNGVRRELGAMNILRADNSVQKGVEVASDLKIDGSSTKNGYDKDDRSFDESKVVGNVYKYWTDEDGVITKMESVVALDDSDTEAANDYEYVAKNDRLEVNGQSYALEDADVIFAVTKDYIDHDGGGDLSVNDSNVLAVKQEDIPDIGDHEDTDTAELDTNSVAGYGSWVNNENTRVVISADKNKDVSAAILGVTSFNKFNAASTKVGLVTNVSYDKNDVVSIDVAYNGKVETISSAEDTDFDDVVSVLDYTSKKNTKDYSVGSRTEKINNGLMAGSTLKDYLNKSAAYAEISTDADGNLTEVLFMDQKTDNDGAGNNNVVIGDYYQVTRKVIADVTEGKWISTVNKDVKYVSDDMLESIDTKNDQTVASDFADEVFYYTIDGKPTRQDDKYAGKSLSILDDAGFRTNFDGNPDITAAEASDVIASDIRNDDDAANDLYYVADIASEIADDGKGDVTAVYMFEDELDEADGASVDVKDIQLSKDGYDVTGTATVKGNVTVDSVKVFVGNTEVSDGTVTATVSGDTVKVTATKDAVAQTYTLKLYDRKGNVVGTDTFEVLAKAGNTLADTKAGEVTTEGVKAVVGRAATATYPVTYVGDGKFYVAVNGDVAGAFEVTADTDAATTANAIATAIGSKVSGYTVAVADTTKVKITAGANADEDVTLEIVKGSEYATLGDAEAVTEGQATVTAEAGVAKLTLAGNATEAEAGTYTLTIGSKSYTITVDANDTTSQIANKIATELLGDADLSVAINGSELTFTEKSGKEGTVIVKDATVSFAKA